MVNPRNTIYPMPCKLMHHSKKTPAWSLIWVRGWITHTSQLQIWIDSLLVQVQGSGAQGTESLEVVGSYANCAGSIKGIWPCANVDGSHFLGDRSRRLG